MEALFARLAGSDAPRTSEEQLDTVIGYKPETGSTNGHNLQANTIKNHVNMLKLNSLKKPLMNCLSRVLTTALLLILT